MIFRFQPKFCVCLIAFFAIWISSISIVHSQAERTYEPSGPVKNIESRHDFIQWATYYYLFPRPKLTVQALLLLDKDGTFDRTEGHGSLIALFSQIFAQNPKELSTWVKDLSPMALDHKRLVWNALWLAHTPESQDAANLIRQQLPENEQVPLFLKSTTVPKPIISMDFSPAVLDMLWASFFITGDSKYINRIIESLAAPAVDMKDEGAKIVAYAACWSLTSNAIQHKRVLEICTSAEATYPELKSDLESIVAKARCQLNQK